MQYITAKPGDRLDLGREGENRARAIRIEISTWKEIYGDGVVILLHQREGDVEPYPCAVTVKDGVVEWIVTNADTAQPGRYGRYELQYHFGDGLSKSCVGQTVVLDALGEPTEEPPEAAQGWLDNVLAAGAVAERERIKAEQARGVAEQAAEKAEEKSDGAEKAAALAIISASEAAKSETNAREAEKAAKQAAEKAEETAGKDGVSPVVEVTPIDGGHRVTITDAEGEKIFDVLNGAKGPAGIDGAPGIPGVPGPAGADGAPGEDGVSPSVEVAIIDGGHRVTVTDAEGEKIFDVLNGAQGPAGIDGAQGIPGVPGPAGADGAPGEDGEPGKDGVSPTVEVTPIDGGHRVSITDAEGTESFAVMDGFPGVDGATGPAGKDGEPGKDGVSPTVEVTPIDGGTRISITDAEGEKSFDVLDGKDGSGSGTGTGLQGIAFSEGADLNNLDASGDDVIRVFRDLSGVNPANAPPGKETGYFPTVINIRNGLLGGEILQYWIGPATPGEIHGMGTEVYCRSVDPIAKVGITEWKKVYPADGSGGVTSWNDLTDKPFGEEELGVAPMEIIWDGNSNGRISVPMSDYLNLVKVSEKTPAPNELKKGTLFVDGNTVTIGKDVFLLDATAEGTPLAGLVVEALGTFMPFVVAAYEPVIYSGMTFPEAGLYFMQNTSSGAFVEKLNLDSVEQLVVTTIDPKYIKDMYYAKQIEKVIVPEQEFAFADNQSTVNELWDIELGKTYQVVWDGTTYECVSFQTSFNGMTVIALGNLGMLGGTNTGEPFLCGVIGAANMSGLFCADNETHTVRIFANDETVHKLDNKYLDLAWLPTASVSVEELYSEINYGNFYMPEDAALKLYSADEAQIIFNSEEYHLKPARGEFGTGGYVLEIVWFGNATLSSLEHNNAADTGEPFCITIQAVGDRVVNIDLNVGNGVTMESITIKVPVLVYNQLPKEFLSNKVQELTGTSYNDDFDAIETILSELREKGVSVCKYNRKTYAVLGGLFDDGGNLLLASVNDFLNSEYGLYALWYSGFEQPAVLLPCLTNDAIYLGSSTAGSTKRFKITVDDSGTLTTTEVTG